MLRLAAEPKRWISVTGGSCLGLFDTCPCDATVPRVAQT
jgi:hypothetical protein